MSFWKLNTGYNLIEMGNNFIAILKLSILLYYIVLSYGRVILMVSHIIDEEVYVTTPS